MKQINYFCDRCGNKIESGQQHRLTVVGGSGQKTFLGWHLCGECFEPFIMTIDGLQKIQDFKYPVELDCSGRV
jgi:hypothetical protein